MSAVTKRRFARVTPVGLVLLVGAGLFVWARLPENGSILAKTGQAFAADVTPPTAAPDYRRLAETDPIGLLNACLQRYNGTVRDYTCVFTKTELLPGGMSPEQEIEVLFKDAPFSVVMNFTRNPGLAQKLLYVKGQNDGLVIIRPVGLLAVVAPSVTRPVDGPDAVRNSRKTLDKFGFANMLTMLRDVSVKARDNGELLELKYLGEREVDGRKTYAFERRVANRLDRYPDIICVFHIDQEWLLPTAVTAMDNDGNLLGRYVFNNVKLNVGLSDTQFTRAANGL